MPMAVTATQRQHTTRWETTSINVLHPTRNKIVAIQKVTCSNLGRSASK